MLEAVNIPKTSPTHDRPWAGEEFLPDARRIYLFLRQFDTFFPLSTQYGEWRRATAISAQELPSGTYKRLGVNRQAF